MPGRPSALDEALAQIGPRLPPPAPATAPPAPKPQTSAQDAARHLIRLENATKSFRGFVELHHPSWTLAPFQSRLVSLLDRLERGILSHPETHQPIRRILINWPPRHAKTTFATKLFTAYCICKKPHRKTLTAAYGSALATDYGGAVRDYVTHPFTIQAFSPSVVGEHMAIKLDPDTRARDFWKTLNGGQCAHVGIDGVTTGRPANLLTIDDPVKSRAEAESATYRNRTWNFYTSSLATRQEPDDDGQPAMEVVCLTRWHPDDLGGRIIASDEFKNHEWLHLVERAIIKPQSQIEIQIADLPHDDPRYQPRSVTAHLHSSKRIVHLDAPEQALWPERFPLADLHRNRKLNARDFEALYQQNPYIEGGNILKLGWWRYYQSDIPPTDFQSLIIAADTASKTSELNDYSVLMVMGLDSDGDIYIVDVLRGKWEFPDLKRLFIHVNAKWRGKNLRAIYVEDKSSGTPIIQELKRTPGLAIIEHKVVHDKLNRVAAITPMIEGGRVYLPAMARWLDDFIQECVEFGPNAQHDDQVDALTIGLDVLARMPTASSWDAAMMPLSAHGSLNSLGLPKNSPSLNRQINWRPPALGS